MSNPPVVDPNNANNVIATFFGMCRRGTSRLFDILTTLAVFFIVAFFLDSILSQGFKESARVIAAVIVFGPASISAMWWYSRASADNRIRRAIKLAPPNTTVDQIRKATQVQDVV